MMMMEWMEMKPGGGGIKYADEYGIPMRSADSWLRLVERKPLSVGAHRLLPVP